MLTTDDVLDEDWQGLESELERLFIIYGYPVDDLQDATEIVNGKTCEIDNRATLEKEPAL